jgi:hypothetical protein
MDRPRNDAGESALSFHAVTAGIVEWKSCDRVWPGMAKTATKFVFSCAPLEWNGMNLIRWGVPSPFIFDFFHCVGGYRFSILEGSLPTIP